MDQLRKDKTMGDFLMGIRGLVKQPHFVTEDDFNTDFIARSLSRQGRYLGHGNHYLSVAEHCVEVSLMVPPEHALVALMHDAPEAFVGDTHSYIKDLMRKHGESVFDDLEDFFWKLIADKYDLPKRIPTCVHNADVKIRKLEMFSLFSERKVLAGLNPRDAEDLFLDRFFELTEGNDRYADE